MGFSQNKYLAFFALEKKHGTEKALEIVRVLSNTDAPVADAAVEKSGISISLKDGWKGVDYRTLLADEMLGLSRSITEFSRRLYLICERTPELNKAVSLEKLCYSMCMLRLGTSINKLSVKLRDDGTTLAEIVNEIRNIFNSNFAEFSASDESVKEIDGNAYVTKKGVNFGRCDSGHDSPCCGCDCCGGFNPTTAEKGDC